MLAHIRALTSEPFAVDEFILFESRLSRHGAHYEEVENYPLG
jgi:RNA 2',3'-cyclic 3'-phosphodiesterase